MNPSLSRDNLTAYSLANVGCGRKMAVVERPHPKYNNLDAVLHAHLERQDRNECVNLACQMGYDGSNLAFVFYENRVRCLMDESPYDKRRLEVLRAICMGQPREMINLFCALMKGMTTAQRIEKASSRLRQQYRMTGGLTSEPKISNNFLKSVIIISHLLNF